MPYLTSNTSEEITTTSVKMPVQKQIIFKKISKRHAASQYKDLMGRHTGYMKKAFILCVSHCSCLQGWHWMADLRRKGSGTITEECGHLSELLLVYDTFIAEMTVRM